MKLWLRLLPVAVLLILVGGFVWRLANPPDELIPSKLVGRPLPGFALQPALPGKAGLSSADLASGEPRLVNLFASWCVPCIAEAPVLERLRGHGVSIDGIAIRDRPDDIAIFLARHGDPFERLGADPNSQVQLALGSSGVPESFVVDGRGIVRHQHIGPILEHDVPEILHALEQAQ